MANEVNKEDSLSVVQKEDSPPVKKKGKPRGGNSPVIGTNGYNLEAGDNARFLQQNRFLMGLPNIDMHSEEEVRERIDLYFDFMVECDTKPTVAGMAMALNGMSRQTLWAITHDAPMGGRGNYSTLPPSVTDLIKKGYKIMEMLWEDYMQNGKLNPVTGIFLGKNNFGYQDKTEYVLTPNQQQNETIDANAIRQRYLTDSADSNSEEEIE